MLQDAAAIKDSATDADRLNGVIDAARRALLAKKSPEGWWCFEFEADVTIPAEYILLNHFMGTADDALEHKIAAYIRRIQKTDGSWSLYPQGKGDVSCTVKAYYALKLTGEDIHNDVMTRAREWILSQGGAETVNMFTRIALALFGQISYHSLPAMPTEIILLPRWFPFNMFNIASWSRTVIAPLLILMAKKPVAANPRGVNVRELFVGEPDATPYFKPKSLVDRAFGWLDKQLHAIEPHIPARLREKAIRTALRFTIDRLNGEDGVNGIFPAMANALMAMQAMGFSDQHPLKQTCRRSIDRLVYDRGAEAYCQPCLSPTWDTAIACHAILEADQGSSEAIADSITWLEKRQISEPGDWSLSAPHLVSGGWAFQFNNPLYPDLDDTAMVASAIDRARRPRVNALSELDERLQRADGWIIGMQSSNGGYAAYDKNNNKEYINRIPFADHGAMLDPTCVDCTARCVGYLAQRGYGSGHWAQKAAIDYIRSEQEPNGSWYGRWGVNYIYGAWSALSALNMAGETPDQPYIQKAVAWLKDVQNADGGWGESCDTYQERHFMPAKSVASQTAWALLGLMAAGEHGCEAVRRGVEWLMAHQTATGFWSDGLYTGTGFPRMFYLQYHGYQAYFPLLALARWRNLSDDQRQYKIVAI